MLDTENLECYNIFLTLKGNIMEKITLSKEIVIGMLNFLAEQKLKDSIQLFVALEKEAVPQLQVQVEKTAE